MYKIIDNIDSFINDPDTSIDAKIAALKSGRKKLLPDIQKLKEQWNPALHKVMDPLCLPDKVIKNDDGEMTRLQKVNRISIPFQQRIVNTAVSFAFGNPIVYFSDPIGSAEQTIFEGIKKIDKKLKLKSHNRRIYRELLRATEVAEYWYAVDTTKSHQEYGFETKLKFKVALFSPFKGDQLYPYFDATDDLVAFCRAYESKVEQKTVHYFEVYTANWIIKYEAEGNNEWMEQLKVPNILLKIPVVYACNEDQIDDKEDEADWTKVQVAIERLEYLLSKFAETNDYHAAPKLVAKGKVMGFADKGESGAILEVESDGDLKYLDWSHATESVKLEIDTLLKFVYSMTQTPDISFESLKGMSNISGVALKMLFTDAHLKVMEKREVLDDYLQRRVNILKTFVGMITKNGSAAERIDIEPDINPFMINDDSTLIADLYKATGSKPLLSQKTAIKTLNWVSDNEEELKQIQEEERAANMVDMTEPTF